MLPIDKGIPVPMHRRGQPFRYPFGAMAIGDSFLVPNGKVNAVRAGASRYARTRQMPNGAFVTLPIGLGVYRCWRVA